MAAPWPIEERDLSELDLDLQNVRIPGGELDESAIANYLVEAADLLELIQDILRDGYLDNELPVVVVERGRYVVLEANRRAAALKAILKPALLGKSALKVERLLERYPQAEPLSRVRVMVAPSRAAAQPLLARLHTRNPKKAWLREQQAVFYHAQLSANVSVNDLKLLYPSEAKSIVGFIRMGEMRELIRGIRYDDHELGEFVQESRLKMTAFEYAYDLPKVQQALGLSFNKDGLLASKRLSAGQRRGLQYLLGRFKARTLNTRSAELQRAKPEHETFAKELARIVAGNNDDAADILLSESSPAANTSDGRQRGAEVTGGERLEAPTTAGRPDPSTSGAVGQAAAGKPGKPDRTEPASPSPRGPNRGDTRSRLDMEGFEYKGSSSGLRRRFEELKRLDLRDFPNAAYDLLRTVLECSIKDHFVTARQNRLAGRNLAFCVTELAKAYQSDARMTALINTINRRGALPAAQFAGTTSALNVGNHEPDAFASSADVHEAWDRIKPILIEIVGK
ncbi:hypothetical protein BXY51_003385 [Actinoplanes cyaneus]|nr:hypothetical protein [Actinoplanes cyaneus]